MKPFPKFFRIKIFFTFSLFFFGACLQVSAEQVRHVIDGDTIILENDQKVRLIGIDAPEVDHPRYNRLGEVFGEEAKAYLTSRIAQRSVRLESGPEAFDKYGRRLSYVYLEEECLNETLLREGYAEAIRHFPYERKQAYLALEAEARREGRGMWSENVRIAEDRNAKTGRLGMTTVIFAGLVVLVIFGFLQKRR